MPNGTREDDDRAIASHYGRGQSGSAHDYEMDARAQERKTGTWEVEASHVSFKRTQELLAEGWEPFSAYNAEWRTVNGNGLHIVFRRRRT